MDWRGCFLLFLIFAIEKLDIFYIIDSEYVLYRITTADLNNFLNKQELLRVIKSI